MAEATGLKACWEQRPLPEDPSGPPGPAGRSGPCVFGVAWAFGVVRELAVGIVLLTACPGGAHSNLYADLARGDVALSVTLTAVSGFITIVTIPPLVLLATTWLRTKSPRGSRYAYTLVNPHTQMSETVASNRQPL